MLKPSIRYFVCCLLCTLLPAGVGATNVDYLSFATEDETNSTEIFRKASPAVVYVTNTALARSLFSLDVLEIPQ
ncbi:MAG TPA: 2-alkenal reductase, partial [Halioglobus sp.]